MKKELGVSIGMLVLTGCLFYLMTDIEVTGAKMFPRVVISILFLLAVCQGIYAVIKRPSAEKKSSAKKSTPYPWGKVLTVTAGVVMYISLMEFIGFYASSFLFIVAVTLIIQPNVIDAKCVTTRIASSLVFVGVLYVLFNLILAVQTPKGFLI